MNRLIEYFMNNKRVVNMIMLLVVLAGIYSGFMLKREQMPPISFEILQITTYYPGAAPEDVEINVTNKIEDNLREVENIKRMTSMSMENVSMIVVEIDSDAGDPTEIKTNIRDAIGRVSDLPEVVTERPVIKEIKATNIPVLEISITGDADEKHLRKYAKDLESRLNEVSGVSKIEKIGYRNREVKIDVRLEDMKKNAISFSEIVKAIRSRNVRLTGGTIESYVSEKKILTLTEYEQAEDVKNVIVRSNYEGYNIVIDNIAEIEDDFKDADVLYRGNGKPGIALIVTQQANSDIIELSDNLKNELEEFKKSLPSNVKAEIIYDFSMLTHIMLDIVTGNGVVGFVFVLLIMFLFLDRRSAFWSAVGIPFSIVGSLIIFKLMDINLSAITLSTMILLLGILVDDAIVIIEKIFTNQQKGDNSYAASLKGVLQMKMPVIAAVVTTILAFAPILFIGGIMGKFCKGIPLVVIILLSVSLVEALFFIPAHMNHAPSLINSKKNKKARKKRILPGELFMDFMNRRYKIILYKAMNYRKIVIALYIVIFSGVGFYTCSSMKFMLDEDPDIDFFGVIIEAPQGTSLSKTSEMVKQVEKIIENTIGNDVLESYTTQIGHHNINDLATNAGRYSNWAAIKVYLKPAAQRDINSEVIMADVQKKLDVLRGKSNFKKLAIESMGGLPVGKALQVVFISNDNQLRDRFEKETIELLRVINKQLQDRNGNKQDAITMIESSNVQGKTEKRLILNYGNLAQMGLTALDVAQTVRTAFGGNVVTSIRKDGEDVDFRVRIKNAKQYREEKILTLPVANREGRLIPMKHFARFEKDREGSAVIHHYSGKRSVTVSANVNVNQITSHDLNEIIKNKIGEKINKSNGIRMKLTGQEEETEKSISGFLFAFLVVLISIYFILVMLFDSYLQPVLVMSIIPFAVISASFALHLHGRPLIFISIMGMLGLVGVVINDTIVMITHLNEVNRKMKTTIFDLVDAAANRFRPIVLTTVTTFVGLLPTSYGIGGDLPTIRPLVLVVAWGLVFSTLATLGFVPLLYSFIMKIKVKL